MTQHISPTSRDAGYDQLLKIGRTRKYLKSEDKMSKSK